jgi:hypothetical protein
VSLSCRVRTAKAAPLLVALVGMSVLLVVGACGDGDDDSAESAKFCEVHAEFTKRRNEALASDPGSEGTVVMKQFLQEEDTAVSQLRNAAPSAIAQDVRTMIDSYKRYGDGDRPALDAAESAATRVDTYSRENCARE